MGTIQERILLGTGSTVALRRELKNVIWPCPVSCGMPTSMTRIAFFNVCMAVQEGKKKGGVKASVKILQKIGNACCSLCPVAQDVREFFELKRLIDDGEGDLSHRFMATIYFSRVQPPESIRIYSADEINEIVSCARPVDKKTNRGLEEAKRYAVSMNMLGCREE